MGKRRKGGTEENRRTNEPILGVYLIEHTMIRFLYAYTNQNYKIMIDFNDKKLDYAKRMGYVDDSDPNWEYSFVGAWLKKYPNRVGILETFKSVCGHTPTWDDITDRTLKEVRDVLETKMCGNSLRSTFLKIKAVINDNKEEVSIPTSRSKEILKQKIEPCKNIYLTPDEILRFSKVDVSSNKEKYIQAVFVISCLTGCRHSDAVCIKKNNIEKGALHYVSIKTRKLSYVRSSRLLEKFIDVKESLGDMTVSDNYFNLVLKDIAKKAEINELVSVFNAGEKIVGEKWKFMKSHTGRRSFVTNKFEEGYTIEQIMRAAGHSSVAMTMGYISCEVEAI